MYIVVVVAVLVIVMSKHMSWHMWGNAVRVGLCWDCSTSVSEASAIYRY